MTKMFSCKHYRYFANLFGTTKTRQDIQIALVKFFKEDNPKFDEDKFLNATIKARLGQ